MEKCKGDAGVHSFYHVFAYRCRTDLIFRSFVFCFFVSFVSQRYDQAEAEFVAAKIDMHLKQERKEALTEHLMVIIQKNEERKALKLEELMHKMGISEQVGPGLGGCDEKPDKRDKRKRQIALLSALYVHGAYEKQ